MNMHGIMTPIDNEGVVRDPSFWERSRDWLWQRRMFGLIVVLPSIILAGYLYLIASNQYESEAHFLVRSSVSSAPPTGMSAALSLVTGAADASQSEAMSVADYLTSHDVVDTLRRDSSLVERFSRPDVDYISRLRSTDPTPEKLFKYYGKQVSVKYESGTGITVLKVHSFRPQDSYELVEKLLELGEKRVNVLNERSYTDAITISRRQLAQAEQDLAGVQARMTAFRQVRNDIDPAATGTAQIGIISSLTAQLSIARAQLSAVGATIDHASPQYTALARRVAALQAQVSAQSGRLVGGSGAIASDISGFEDLKLRQGFLAKRYEAAAASLEKAREQARNQQLYLVRVVDPNMPVKALFPERFRILATLVIALLLTYAIGWLLAAGVREHAH